MEEQILKLREQGLSYKQIREIVGCAKSTVAYYCSQDVKMKAYIRCKNNPNLKILKGISAFLSKKIKYSIETFHRKEKSTFGLKDILNKFGEDTKCYLTGKNINLYLDSYHFDHIIPISKGGSNTIDNLGIVIPEANMSKTNLLLDEYIELCKKVLENFGYTVTK